MKRQSFFWSDALAAVLLASLLAGCGAESKKNRHAGNAEEYFSSGDYDRAEIEYRNLLQADPGNVHALRQMGTIWFDRGAPLQAIRYLGKARELVPDDVDGRLKFGNALLSLGERAAAWKEAQELLELAPGNGEAIILLAMSAADEAQAGETERLLAGIVASGGAPVPLASAILAMRRGDLTGAGAAIDQALTLDPGSSKGLVLKADWHRARGDADAAEACLQAALHLAPPRSPTQVAYATFLMGSGKREAAIAFLKQCAADTPDFLPPWRMLARDALDRKEYEEAGSLLENVFAKDGGDLEASLLQSQAWLARGDAKDIGKAVLLMEKLGGMYPSNPLIQLQLAKVLLKEGKSAPAAAALERAVQLNPEFRDAILLQAELKLRQSQPREAAASLEDWLVRKPADLQARMILADAYRTEGRLDDAVKLLRESAEMPDAGGPGHFRLGLILRQQGKSDEARASFEKAGELSPDSIAVTAQLVELDLAAGDFAAATARAKKQLEAGPEVAKSHYLVATVLARQENWAAAESALEEAIRLDPAFMPAYGLLIRSQVASGRTEEAVEQLKQVLAIHPDDLPARMSLGMIHQAAGRTEEARPCYEEIIRENPSFAPALNNLAALLGESSGDLEKARELARKALALLPGNAEISDTLGWISYKMGDHERAFTLLTEASEGLPDSPVVWFHLGMASCATANEAMARRAFAAASSSAEDFPEKPEAARHLAFINEPEGRGAAGISRLQERVRQEPMDLISRMKLAALLEEEARHADAAVAYGEVLGVYPDVLRANLQLARLHAGPLGNPRKALEYATQARRLAPDDDVVAALLGKLCFLEGDHERADRLLQESYAKRKDDTALMLDVAWAAYSVGRVDEARKIMEAVRDGSGNPAETSAAAKLLDFPGRNSGTGIIDQALEADPKHVPALMARAVDLEQRNEAAAALRDYETILGIYPKFRPAREAADRIRAAKPADP